ncbi:hypothetical protein HOE22_01485 [Candidatus Woesearchaeota archaeon]|jgi:hypothetical protein|nr:hypothetical protein [Candidatus Woesearchaeota archaeon]MBT7558626.1 hypothetical protein [Candidatus Woesearchaeota archaeon]
MIKLKDLLNEIKIKVLDGHLTATDKRAIKHMIEKQIWKGRVGKSDWFIKELGNGKYDITQKVKDKGLVPVAGTKFRISTYISKILVKENTLNESMYIAPLTVYWIELNGISKIVILQIEDNEVKFWHEKTSKIMTMKLNKASKLIERGSRKWAESGGGIAYPKIVKSLEKNFAGKKGLSTHNGAQKRNKGIMNIVNSLEK